MMSEEVMELEIKEEPKEEEEEKPKEEGAVSAGGGLTLILKNPEIRIDKLIVRKEK